MALLNKREPSAAELRVFGLVMAAVAGIVGALAIYIGDAWRGAIVAWLVGLALCLVYYTLPPTRILLYNSWMAVVYPIGWLVSHGLMAMIYYLLMTPIGLVMRLFGRDPLNRDLEPSTTTYWSPLDVPDTRRRYFQQF
jgi:hypothetical protein